MSQFQSTSLPRAGLRKPTSKGPQPSQRHWFLACGRGSPQPLAIRLRGWHNWYIIGLYRNPRTQTTGQAVVSPTELASPAPESAMAFEA